MSQSYSSGYEPFSLPSPYFFPVAFALGRPATKSMALSSRSASSHRRASLYSFACAAIQESFLFWSSTGVNCFVSDSDTPAATLPS